MFRFFAAVLFSANFVCGVSHARPEIVNVLSQAEFSNLSEKDKTEAQKSALWSDDLKYVSFCFHKSCYFIDFSHSNPIIVDISRAARLEYFGTDPSYDRLENRPIIVSADEREVIAKWGNFDIDPRMVDERHVIGVLIRTRIWNNGQRYTTQEPVLIEDGVYNGR